MTSSDLFRVEFREQNSVPKYYLIREIFSDSRKFSASRLITSGTPPAKAQISRCAALYGFDLELKCIAKAVKYRVEHFRYDLIDGGDAVVELERHRLLQSRKASLVARDTYAAEFIAAAPGTDVPVDEVSQMFSVGTLPRGSTLHSVNYLQNIYTAIRQREKKPLTAARVARILKTLSQNIEDRELSDTQRDAVEKLLDYFYQRIRQGFYPFEQCLLAYEGLAEIFPHDPLLVYVVYGELLENFGYRILPRDADSMERALAFVHGANSELEREVRRLNEQKFRVKAGGKQKRLEFFE
ncbi:MAG TPA: hypothetical protein O0X27_06515 [Methanocorpusculum sp.]|nr:hypothetical protein [Methanocorpusculum sp.]